MSDRKKLQLGMNPSTANGRLVKDILWKLICQTNQDICCKCGKHMTRATFSIEHITPWLDSDNPTELYFDLKNISFSHLSCNISVARKPNATGEDKKVRCARVERERWNRLTKEEQQEIRKNKYKKYSC
jgi:hypothetical protein